MDTKSQIDRLIACLEFTHEKPHYQYVEDGLPILNFLMGFRLACRVLEVSDKYEEIITNVRRERGWAIGAMDPIIEMIDRGIDNNSIIKEALMIELLTWKRIQELSNRQ